MIKKKITIKSSDLLQCGFKPLTTRHLFVQFLGELQNEGPFINRSIYTLHHSPPPPRKKNCWKKTAGVIKLNDLISADYDLWFLFCYCIMYLLY